MENIKEILKEELGNLKNELKEAVIGEIRNELPEMVKAIAPKEDEDPRIKQAKVLNAIVKGDVEVLKTLTEGTDTEGGYLVPEELLPGIVQVLGQYGVVRKAGAKVLKVKSDTFKVNRVSGTSTVYYPNEGSAITESSATNFLAQVSASIKKAGVAWSVTEELSEDAIINIDTLLAKDVAMQFAKDEDTQILAGSGSPFTGLLNNSSIQAHTLDTGETAFSNLTFDDILDAIGKLDTAVQDGAVVIMHPSVWNMLRKKKDSNNQYYLGLGKADRSLWGYPVLLSSVMPSMDDSAADTAFVVVGNFSYLYIGERRSISVRKVFDKSIMGDYLLFTRRWAPAVVYDNAFCVIKTAAS